MIFHRGVSLGKNTYSAISSIIGPFYTKFVRIHEKYLTFNKHFTPGLAIQVHLNLALVANP